MTETHLEVSRLIRADRARVFEAWTTPALIVRWWGAGGVVCTDAEVDLRVGGSYRIANLSPDGQTMWVTGTFTDVSPPESLTYSWAMEPLTSETIPSVVRVRFDEIGSGTMVTINHTRIRTDDERELNTIGWNGCLDGLGSLFDAARDG